MPLHPHLRHSLLASALLLASGLAVAAEPTVIAKELQQAKTYTVSSAPTEPLHMDPPKLPDLSGFTAEAVQNKIDRRHKGKVSVRRMLQEESLKEFIGGDNKAAEWVQRQHGIPQAIFVDDGHVDLVELSKKVPKQYLSEVEPGVYLARLPIVVGQKGILEINGKVKQRACPRRAARFWSTTASCSSATPRSPAGARRTTAPRPSARPRNSARSCCRGAAPRPTSSIPRWPASATPSPSRTV